MHGARFILLIAASAIALSSAVAQTPPRPGNGPGSAAMHDVPIPKPYRVVAVTPAQTFNEPGFQSFRAELAEMLRKRVYPHISRYVVAQGFFWDGDFDGEFDPLRSGAENLANAVKLERGAGSGWGRLIALAMEASAAPSPSRPGVVCAPANPTFDDVEFARLLDTTGTNTRDWVYPRVPGLEARPAPSSPIVERLGMHFVRLMRDDAATASSPGGSKLTRIVLPAGRIAFVATDAVRSLRTDRLCYGKDISGRWHIVGYVAGRT